MDINFLRIVADAHKADAENFCTSGVTVQRVRGGANNAMYRARKDNEDYAIKLCVIDERRRAWREHTALELFESMGLNIAPNPVLLDESCVLFPYPIVVYQWLEGEPIGSCVTQDQLVELLFTIQQTHSIRPDDVKGREVLDATFHHFALDWYLGELLEFFSKYGEWLSTCAQSRETHVRLKRLVEICIQHVSKADVDVSRVRVSPCFCHVDSNFGNVVWKSGEPLRWVDWEYSGWGDPALELSEFQWHLGADVLTETQRHWLRENYQRPANDRDFEERLAIWDRILVTRWTLLIARILWSAHHGPDRVRLTMPDANPSDLQVRLVRTIERAERFVLDKE